MQDQDLYSQQRLAAIFSLEGPEITEEEKEIFSTAKPYGFILFARNCQNAQQVKKLTQDLQEIAGLPCPVLIDQEGGRVQRLKPPEWRSWPNAAHFGALAKTNLNEGLETIRSVSECMALECKELGITVNCAPVLDVMYEQTHSSIGDRAYSDDAALVSILAQEVCTQFLSVGVTPVIKHMPGHGRAQCDSHLDLPVINAPLQAMIHTDFRPFKELAAQNYGSALWGMSAHIIYSEIDPDYPASLSADLIQNIIRSYLGFEGVLLSDDLDMKALQSYGDIGQRAKICLQAGCDLALYCAGNSAVMKELAEILPNLSEISCKRLQKAAEFTKVAA